MFCHKWKEVTLFPADAQYKASEGEHTPHQQIERVNSTHRTDLKGVKIGSRASKTCKLCVIGSPVSCKYFQLTGFSCKSTKTTDLCQSTRPILTLHACHQTWSLDLSGDCSVNLKKIWSVSQLVLSAQSITKDYIRAHNTAIFSLFSTQAIKP